MYFKNKPLLVVVLLVIIVGFSIFSTMNAQSYYESYVIEGMTDYDSDDDLPACTNELAPTCSSTVQDEAASTGANYYDEDYILKTMIVPPVCPVCPSVINQHSHDGEVNSENNRLGGSEYESNETNITNISNITNSTRMDNAQALPEDFGRDEENEELREKNEELRDRLDENTQRQTTANDSKMNRMLQQYENTINDLKGQISGLQQSTMSSKKSESTDGSCPPCPACERCPEPAFSCEKVINYRSPSAGQYLPMPVLGDFSSFKNN